MPKRVQRTRLAGQPAIPEGAVYVGRARGDYGRWGNPFRIGIDADDATHATALYREWLENNSYDVHPPNSSPEYRQEMDDRRDWILTHARELAGKDLACWCKPPADGQPDPCHARVLMEYANTLLLRDKFGTTLADSLTVQEQNTAVDAYTLIQATDGPHTARAWMIGMNPHLDDQAPILALRDGRSSDVMAAARAYLEGVYA
jgi:hypothetical protein